MNAFEKDLLERFYRVYYDRVINKSSLGINKKNIELKNTTTGWYFDNIEEYNMAIKNLEEHKIIYVEWNEHKDPLKFYLLSPETLPNLINSKPYPSLKKIIEKCNQYDSKIIDKFKNRILTILSEQKSMKIFIKDGNIDDDWIRAIDAAVILEKMIVKKIECLERDFSQAAFKDSKALEKYISKIKYIFESDLPNEEFYQECGLSRFSNVFQVRGNKIIHIGKETVINLNEGKVWGIPLPCIFSCEEKLNILTVENLTSFFDIDYNEFDVILYLGGQPSTGQIQFLKYISLQNNLSHWGDLDAGGFTILTVMRKNGVNIHSFNMELNFLKMNQEFFIPIDEKKSLNVEEYINSLCRLENNVYLTLQEKDCVNYLYSNKLWYEQESFYAKKLLENLK